MCVCITHPLIPINPLSLSSIYTHRHREDIKEAFALEKEWSWVCLAGGYAGERAVKQGLGTRVGVYL